MNLLRKIATKPVMVLDLYITTRTKLRAIVAKLLMLFPGLKARLKMIDSQPPSMTIAGLEQLSPRARRIYADLKDTIDQHQKGKL